MKKIFLLLMMGMFMLSFTSAVAPTTTIFTGEVGINIEVNIMEAYKVGEPRFTIIHLFNTTNGYQLTNTTNNNIDCHIHLRGPQGFELMDLEAEAEGDHWFLNGSSGGSNPSGLYSWTLTCQDNTANVGGYASGFYEITANGRTEPEGIIIVVFSIILILILAGSLVMIVKAVGHIIDKDFDLMDVAKMWGLYFGLLMINQLAIIYLGNVDINNWLDLFVKTYGFPMVIVPVIAFLLSLFNMDKQKKEREKQW